MDVQTVFTAVVIRAPDGFAQGVIGHDVAPILGQLAQQSQFSGGQGKGGTVRKLDQRIVELDDAVPQCQLLRSAPRQLGAVDPLQNVLYPQEKLLHEEGFGQIIVCAKVQPEQPVGIGIPCGEEQRRDIDRVLDIVHLTKDADRNVGQYSLGMKQRLGIAMALLGSPKLLILDEPTNGLDPAGIQEMRSLIAAMPQTTGATVLISSHLLGEIEQMVDQVGILNHGKLLFEGSLQQLQKHSRGGILLRVLDVSKALAVLNEQGMQAAARTEEPDVVLLPPQDDAALAALVCALAERGAGVVGLTAQTKSLEDIFLSLTQNSGEVA